MNDDSMLTALNWKIRRSCFAYVVLRGGKFFEKRKGQRGTSLNFHMMSIVARRAFKSALFVIRDYVHSFHSQELFQRETGRASFDSGRIPNSVLRRYFTTSAEQSSSEAEALSLGRELDAETHDQEFMRWSDGGGMFHRSSRIDPTARIEIGAVVHSDAVVEENVCIGSGTVVGPGVVIGQSTKTGYMVSLSNCLIGDFCHIHNGVCIGQDGFGFFVNKERHMVKKPQNLLVRIGNHVEIGANTCIDRGSWRDTVVGDYTKIDNLVQIGHNVVLGKNCMFCGQAGIAGSVTIGDYVILGGKAGIRDHVCIASNVRLAANSCVTKNINEPGDYAGFPAVPVKEWRKQIVATRNVTEEYWKKGVSEESS